MRKISGNWLLVALMLLLACTALFFLPETIAVQWNNGEVSGTASKWLLFVFPVFAGILAASQAGSKSKVSDRVCLAIILVLFGVQAVILSNALGVIDMCRVDFQLIQRVVLLLLGGVFVFFGNRLPKYAMNYYTGIKAPMAYSSDDLWTKTQRFAGKLWVLTGVAVLLLAMIPWEGVSVVVFLIVVLTAYLPRIYCKRMYENFQNR